MGGLPPDMIARVETGTSESRMTDTAPAPTAGPVGSGRVAWALFAALALVAIGLIVYRSAVLVRVTVTATAAAAEPIDLTVGGAADLAIDATKRKAANTARDATDAAKRSAADLLARLKRQPAGDDEPAPPNAEGAVMPALDRAFARLDATDIAKLPPGSDALPDYELVLVLEETGLFGTELSVQAGEKRNQSAAAGLTWTTPPICLADLASVKLRDRDQLVSDTIAEVAAGSLPATENGYRFVGERGFDLGRGLESFFNRQSSYVLVLLMLIAGGAALRGGRVE